MCELTGARMSKTLWRKTCKSTLRLFIRGKCLNSNWSQLTRKSCNWPKIECEYTTNICKHTNDTWDRCGQLDHFWIIFWNSPQASKNGSKNGKFPEKSTFSKIFGKSSGVSLEVSKSISLDSWHSLWVSGVSLSVQQIRFTSEISFEKVKKSTHGESTTRVKITKWPGLGSKLQTLWINWSGPSYFHLDFSPSYFDWEILIRGGYNWVLRVNSTCERSD